MARFSQNVTFKGCESIYNLPLPSLCAHPPGLVAVLAEGPADAILQALDDKQETPEVLWSPAMAAHASAHVDGLAATARAAQAQGHYDWSLPAVGARHGLCQRTLLELSFALCWGRSAPV